MPRVNPAILVWARETAGLTDEEAAARLGLRDTRRSTALEKLGKLEGAGEAGADVARTLLLKMVTLYRRPLLTFYLSYVPQKGARGEDFRTLPADYTQADDAMVDALVRDIRTRQSIVREAMEQEDEAFPLEFIGGTKIPRGVEVAVQLLRSTLKMTLGEYRGAPTAEEAFKRLRAHAEAAGIFVVLQGDLGHWRSQISVETFRGFALADNTAPFVVINDKDPPQAWAFTLLHEIVHLCLGETGISAGRPNNELEQFCNEVASAYLVDDAELRQLRINDATDQESARRLITDFARPRHLSSTMVAYRLLRLGVISQGRWNELRQFFRQMWREARDKRLARAREAEGGPSYYTVRRHRIGEALIAFTRRMIADGALSTTKAAQVLAVRPQGVGPLLAA